MRISDWSSDVCSSDLDENALQFDGKEADAFRALRDFVQERLEHPGASPAPASVADELTKLANLRDLGILTLEEFAQQKARLLRSEEHTSELQSLMRISYAVFCLKKKKTKKPDITAT